MCNKEDCTLYSIATIIACGVSIWLTFKIIDQLVALDKIADSVAQISVTLKKISDNPSQENQLDKLMDRVNHAYGEK